MDTPVSDVAFTSTVKAVQSRLGSRDLYVKMETTKGWSDVITLELKAFIKSLDMFYFGTSNHEGQPYIQYKGGAAGFLHAIDDKTLAWADFSGNRQYISTGNLEDNERAFIFLMDYSTGRRIKLWGRARVVDNDPKMFSKLRDDDYGGKVERAVVFELDAWDANCPKHIHLRFPKAQVVPIIEELQARIADLEDQLKTFEDLNHKVFVKQRPPMVQREQSAEEREE